MKHTHTNTPWHLGKRAGNPAIYGRDGEEIAEILHELNDDWRDNARLIASAPSLLTMLRRMLDETSGGGAPCPLTLEHARQAIAKAEGGVA
jgi:hypothetical protein